MLIGLDASRAAAGRRTGTETYTWHLLYALLREGPKHRFRLYSPHPLPPEMAAGLGNVELRLLPFPRLWTHVRLGAEIVRHPPDVLFIPAHVIPLVCPVPAVVTVHDLGYVYHPEAHGRFDRWYLSWSTRRHVRVAAHLVADSQATAADLERLYGADARRITVIYPGRDESLSRVHDARAIERTRHRYSILGPYFLYLGTLQPRKNLVRLVDAFADALPELRTAVGEPPTLVIAGQKGWLYEGIFACVRERDIAEHVRFTGYLDEADKAPLLSDALALVYPSLYEGFGLPLLEAMACGAPILASNRASIPEVAGQAALYFDPLDTAAIAHALVAIAHDRALRRRLQAAGRLQLERFSWQKAAARMLEVLERAAAG